MAHAASSKLAAGYSTIFSTARSSGGQPRVCRFSSYRLRTYQDLTFSLALIEILTKKNSHYTLRVFFFLSLYFFNIFFAHSLSFKNSDSIHVRIAFTKGNNISRIYKVRSFANTFMFCCLLRDLACTPCTNKFFQRSSIIASLPLYKYLFTNQTCRITY